MWLPKAPVSTIRSTLSISKRSMSSRAPAMSAAFAN